MVKIISAKEMKNRLLDKLGEGETMVNLAKEKQPKIRINNSELLAENPEIGIVHINPHVDGGRGVTIAYRKPNMKNPKILEIATAVLHNSDSFTKKIGTRTAIEYFVAGRTINVPVDRLYGVVGSLKRMFNTIY